MKNKTKFVDKSFNLDVSWYTNDALLNLVFDRGALSQLDRGDMVNVTMELARRLQKVITELNSERD